MQTYEEEAPIALSGVEARAGVTGHHVRHVLAFGLLGSLVAFVVLVLYFGHDAIGRTITETWSGLNVGLLASYAILIALAAQRRCSWSAFGTWWLGAASTRAKE
jgi:hypothetical protein